LEKEKNHNGNKKLPYILTGLLTILLLFLFGSEQFDNSNGKKSDIIDDLYSATLKPLFSPESINHKEMLTFAVKGDLPISHSNEVLRIRKNMDGREILELKKNSKIDTNDYYSHVVSEFNFNDERKVELDSILESYKNELSNLVYYKGDSIIAVDPKIGLLRKSINQDIASLIVVRLDSSDKERIVKTRRLYSENNGVMIETPREYILFTPDSVELKEFRYPQMDRKELKVTTESLSKSDENLNVSIELDSNFARVVFVNTDSEDISIGENRLYNLVVDSSKNDVKFSFEISGDSSDNISFKLSYIDSLNNRVKYEMNTDDLGRAFSNSMKMFSGKDLEEWIEYGINIDSISSKIDSLRRVKAPAPVKTREN
jgi:hypothetical protein